MQPIKPNGSIAVVGAGITGLSAAFVLAERGLSVTLIDRADPGRTGPSFGNAGHVVGSGIFPLAEPGIGLRALGMLSRRDGPLKIPPSQWPRLAPWLWRFWRTSYGAAQERAIAALTDLSDGAVDAAEALWARAGIGRVLRRTPALYLYESQASFSSAWDHWKRRVEAGRSSEALSAEQIREMEPALAPIFVRGVASAPYGVVTDPIAVVEGLFAAARSRGVVFDRRTVTSLGSLAGFDAILVAAGAWSPGLAATIGERLPVEAERGYNLTFPGPPAKIAHPLLLADRGVAVSPLEPGLRFGGWSELGGTELPADPGHWATIRRMAEAIIPATKNQPAHEWMGHRPATPDSVPILSRSVRNPSVFYAVGHGHYGLSLSAKTAGVMAALIADGADDRYAAFSMKRFA